MGKPLHAAFNTSRASLSDSLTLTLDGDKPKEVVTIRLLELDKSSGDATETSEDDVFADIEGKFNGDAFNVTKVTPKSADNSLPKLKVSIHKASGATIPVLPVPANAGEWENGILEIDLDLLVDGKAVARKRNPALLRFSKYRKDNRPVITILGGTDSAADPNKYFTGAEEYWKEHADVLKKSADLADLSSLEGILEWMADNEGQYGPWGEVNIVSHGNDFTWDVRLRKSDPNTDDSMVTGSMLERFFQAGNTFAKTPTKFDSDSLIVLRGCEIGTNDYLLQEIRKAFGGSVTIKAPKFVQTYGPNPDNPPSSAPNVEYFKKWFIAYYKEKRSSPPDDAELVKKYTAEHPNEQTNWAARLKEKENRSDWDRQFSFVVTFDKNAYADAQKDAKDNKTTLNQALIDSIDADSAHGGFVEKDTQSSWSDWFWEVAGDTGKANGDHDVKFLGHRWRTTVFDTWRETPTGGTKPVIVIPDLTNTAHYGSAP
jgi:hypothetical protein